MRLRFERGSETYSPVQYFSFQLGAIAVEMVAEEGDTIDALRERAEDMFGATRRKQFQVSLAEHLERCSEAIKAAKARGLGGRG